jgi:tetratricopeptide (TPR) repeat protein
LEDLIARVESLDGDAALMAARRLADEGRDEEAAAALERAGEGVEQRIMRFGMAPTAEALLWLAENAPARLDDWLWSGFGLLTAPPAPPAEGEAPDEAAAAAAEAAIEAARRAVLVALARAIPESDPMDGADLAYVAANLAGEEEAPIFYAMGASLMRAGLSGDPVLDRGYYTFQATLLESAGDVDGARRVLDDAILAFPQEFTYHYAEAGLLQRAELLDEALDAARSAVEVAYGDMSLRAAGREAKILAAMEQPEDAAAVLKAAIEAAERPEEGLEVRTWRYLEMLEAQLAGLEGGDDAEG